MTDPKDEKPEIPDEDLADFDDAAAGQGAEPQPEPETTEPDPELLRAIAEEEDPSPMIPKPRFDEATGKLKDENRELRERLEALEARVAPSEPAAEPRDFAAEEAELRKRYEEDGEISDDELEAGLAAIRQSQIEHEIAAAKEAAKAEARAEFERELAERQRASAEAAWQEKVSAWEAKNEEFLKNGWRRKIASDLFDQYGRDPSLSDEDLIAKVEAEAFEAANWGTAPQDTQHAARNMRDAVAQATASAVPSPSAAGVGNRGKRPGLPENLVGIDDKTFNQVDKMVSPEELADF